MPFARYEKFKKKCKFVFMPTALNIQDILSQVRQLGKDEQFTLLERLIALVRKGEKAPKAAKLSSITGVGSEIWKGTDIDGYIEHERQW
jgi:hypothetical protein